MKENMFYGANNLLFKMADELRENMTKSESILWEYLRINDWKLKFRRQHPIALYIADFYCHGLKLVIEIDGGYHEKEAVKANDNVRQHDMEDFGITVIRFKNEDVLYNLENVKSTIKEKIDLLVQNKALSLTSSTDLFTPLGDGGLPLTVIKIGGNIIDNEQKLASFLQDFVTIEGPKVLVHGGGKLATRMAEAMGVQQQMVDGRRITDAETLKIVTMVYAGYINKNVVAQLQAQGCNAIGLSGADGNVIQAHKRGAQTQAAIDYGFVGDVDQIDTKLLKTLLDAGFTVVLSPITHNKQGQLLNTNADTIAQETAKALASIYQTSLIYSFEKAGVLLDVEDDASVINQLKPTYYQQLKSEQKIFAGMIPKLDNAFEALNSGVQKVVIGKAEQLHSLMAGTSGTTITHE